MFYFSSKANVKEIFTSFCYHPSVMTITRNTFFLIYAVLFLVSALTGCEEQKTETEQFQRRHCEAAASWMAKGEGSVKIYETKSWEQGQERNVSVVYDFRPLRPEEYANAKAMRLLFLCRYPLVSKKDADGKISVAAGRATYMEQGGRPLSTEQIRRLNVLIGLMGSSGAPVRK